MRSDTVTGQRYSPRSRVLHKGLAPLVSTSCFQLMLWSRKEPMMTTVTEIQEAILALRKVEYAELKKWLAKLEIERRWEEWDEQIETDSDADRLEFLESEALEAKANGTLADL